MRLYGQGRAVAFDDAEWLEHAAAFADDIHPYPRQAFFVDVEQVQSSCGYAVPLMEYQQDRLTLDKYCENKLVPREMVAGLPQPGELVRKA
jgi:hypothetical protein